jgi:very-short-patch-repair endonuclease
LSKIEEALEFQLKAMKFLYQRQVKLIPGRKFTFDFLVGKELVVECEGGSWVGGRHTTGVGFEKDCEKYNELQLLGYRLLRCTGRQVKNGQAIKWIDRAIA